MSTCSYGSSCAGNAMWVESLFDTTATVLTLMGPPAAVTAAAPPGFSGELHPAAMHAIRGSHAVGILIAPPPCELRTTGSPGRGDRANANAWMPRAVPARKSWEEETGWRQSPPQVRQSRRGQAGLSPPR